MESPPPSGQGRRSQPARPAGRAAAPPPALEGVPGVPPGALAGVLGHGASDKRIDILARIADCGSISEAARRCGVSYKAAWQALETLANLAGVPLVTKAVGGSGGGGAGLTDAGRQVLAVARELERARAEVLARVLRPTTGPQDSPTAPGGDAVAPPGDPSIGLAALALRTSMRNQLPCRVDQMKPLNGQMLVSLRTAGGDTLESRITRESAQLLGLRPGLPVLALFKATAVSIGAEQPAVDGANRLIGTVTRTSRSATGGELHLGLAGGVGVVGFATETTATPETPPLRRGVQAWAAVDASAIVIATAR